MICQMIGIFLYCGAATQPLAMFPQSNNADTGYMADQMTRSRQYQRDAQSTTFDRCEPGARMWDAQCIANGNPERQCFKGCVK